MLLKTMHALCEYLFQFFFVDEQFRQQIVNVPRNEVCVSKITALATEAFDSSEEMVLVQSSGFTIEDGPATRGEKIENKLSWNCVYFCFVTTVT